MRKFSPTSRPHCNLYIIILLLYYAFLSLPNTYRINKIYNIIFVPRCIIHIIKLYLVSGYRNIAVTITERECYIPFYCSGKLKYCKRQNNASNAVYVVILKDYTTKVLIPLGGSKYLRFFQNSFFNKQLMIYTFLCFYSQSILKLN